MLGQAVPFSNAATITSSRILFITCTQYIAGFVGLFVCVRVSCTYFRVCVCVCGCYQPTKQFGAARRVGVDPGAAPGFDQRHRSRKDWPCFASGAGQSVPWCPAAVVPLKLSH